jgi:hypothetical protein
VVTIQVFASFWYLNRGWPSTPGVDTIIDTIDVTVETPTVDFTIQNSDDWSKPAPWGFMLFLPGSGQVGFNLSDDGTNLRALGYKGTVNNTTDYFLNMSFLQVINNYKIVYKYNDNSVYTWERNTGMPVLDTLKGQSDIFLADYKQQVAPGETTFVPPTATIGVAKNLADSPTQLPPVRNRNGAWIWQITLIANFTTHLIVDGGRGSDGLSPPSTTNPIPGIMPISLSAAYWHVGCVLTNAFNRDNHVTFSEHWAHTFDPTPPPAGNWDMKFAVGPGWFPSNAQPSPDPTDADWANAINGPPPGWTTRGDNTSHYIFWKDTYAATLANIKGPMDMMRRISDPLPLGLLPANHRSLAHRRKFRPFLERSHAHASLSSDVMAPRRRPAVGHHRLPGLPIG